MFKKMPLMLSCLALLSSCSGKSGDGAPPMDAEVIQGNHERAFYKTASDTSSSVVVTEGVGRPTRLYSIDSGKLSLGSEIPLDSVNFSVDEALITINGKPGIFENADLKIADAMVGHGLPRPSIEALCSNVSESGYDEFRIAAINRAFVFLGVNKTTKVLVGGPGPVQKAENQSYVSYHKLGFGTVMIDKQSPSESDPYFLKGSFPLFFPGLNPNPWAAVKGMLCHLNDVAVQ